MGKPKAPAADPRIGDAAMMSAQTGQDYLAYMKDQAAITNQWAGEDRARYQGTFQPLENKYVQDAQDWASPERMAGRVDQNRAAVSANIAGAAQAQQRQMAAMGVAPNSGRSAALGATTAMQTGLALTGAENNARRDVRGEAQAMQANAINMGKGLAVNPATSMGLSNGAASAGFQGAQQGYGQQMQGLGMMHDQQMQAYNAKMGAASDFWGGIGSIVGLAFGSDEETKKDIKAPGRSLLEAVNNMPVKDWTYKDGEGDGGSHTGTMSQDFKRETGQGDGKSINVIDAIGTTMGAIQELSKKVDDIAARVLPPETKDGSNVVPMKRPAAPSTGRSLVLDEAA